MSKVLYRLGHFSVRHRRWVLSLWLVLLVALGVAGSLAGGSTSDKFAIPGTESQKAFDLLDSRFPAQAGSTVQVVFAAPSGATVGDAPTQAAIKAALAAANSQPGVTASDPATSLVMSRDGTVAFAEVRFAAKAQDVDVADITRLEDTIGAAVPATTVSFGGELAAKAGQQEQPSSELVGLGVAVIVLLLSFGSVLAMGLPLVTALLGVGVGITGITLVSAFVDLSATAPILATMIGLAVGIDYALFIVTRHRQNLADGIDIEESIARANATAGGAVVFAGMTVVIALAALTIVGIPFLTVMGLAAAVTVAVAVAIAVTLMPALLAFAGRNIDRFKVPGLKARTGAMTESSDSFSARFARRIIRRPGLSLAAGLAVIAVLAIPLLSMRLGMTDAGSDPHASTTRQAYDSLAKGFGPGFNGPLMLVVDLTSTPDRPTVLTQLTNAVSADPDVVSVGNAVLNPAGDTAVISV